VENLNQNLDTHELAWAAGFYDGEGCTYAPVRRSGKPSERIVLSVGQKTLFCLERFQKAVGGLGRIYHYKGKDFYVWTAQSIKEADTTLNALWPYLSTSKQQQALKHGFKVGVVRARLVGRSGGKMYPTLEDLKPLQHLRTLTLAKHFGVNRTNVWRKRKLLRRELLSETISL
jgi:hypothetical protein